MAADEVSASTEFDIFATRHVQSSTIETIETADKPIASLDESDLEFLVPADHDTYIDLNIQLYVPRKLTHEGGTDLELTDSTGAANNLLHSLFEQCNASLNGVTITHAADLCYYRAYHETSLSYGNEAAATHLTNAFWYRDTTDLDVCDPTAAVTTATNTCFLARCDRLNQSKEIEMVGRLHADICSVSTHLLPGVRMQIKLTKAKRDIYVHSKDADSKTVFKILETQILVKRVRSNPAYLIAHNTALQAGAITQYNMTSVGLKNFTHAKGSQSLSIDNTILGPISKRLLFMMLDNTEFLGSLTTNPFRFQHFDMNYFSLYVNGKQIPSGGLHLDTACEKGSVMAYRHSSLEHGTLDIERVVHKRIFHATLRSDT